MKMKKIKKINMPGRIQKIGGFIFCILVIFVFLSGCTARHYLKSADNEAYRTISEKTNGIPNLEKNFSIETNQPVLLDDMPVCEQADESLGAEGNSEIGARIISLEKALEIAVKNSRTYQTEKENLYLEALNLTLARHRYRPIFSGNAGATYRKEVREGIDKLTDEHSISGSGGVGMDMLLHTGGRIATSFTADFLRFLTGDPRVATSSELAATLTQPLLRGAGYKVAMENLTQSERNLLYALRNFSRFRQQFTVQVARSYFGVLQNKDRVRNEWLGYQSYKRSAARERAFADVGLRKLADLGRLEQEELNAETAWISAVRNYKQSLDQFKILIGLPTDAKIILDDRDLQKLTIKDPQITLEDAVKIALDCRLDFYNVRDQFEDAARKIDIAKNGLLPDLNLVLATSVSSKPGSGLPELDLDRTRWSAGVNVNLPFDRKAERNTYRTALINYQRAKRSLELAVDNIKLDVYDSWRLLDQAKRTYESSELAVELSRRRVEEQDLLAELGRGTAEAKVAAQNSYISSLNQRTSALVNHTIARLDFWRNLGVLSIKDSGLWEEIDNVRTNSTISKSN